MRLHRRTTVAAIGVIVLFVIFSPPCRASLKNAVTLFRHAEAALDRGNSQKALKLIEEALREHAASGIYDKDGIRFAYFPYYLRGKIYEALGDRDKANADWEEEKRRGVIQSDLEYASAFRKVYVDQTPPAFLPIPPPKVLETRRFQQGNDIYEDADLSVTGEILEAHGLEAVTIDGARVKFLSPPESGRYRFEHPLTWHSTNPAKEIVITAKDRSGKTKVITAPLPLPDHLLPKAGGIYAVIVGVNAYRKVDSDGGCNKEATQCGGPDNISCYRPSDLKAAVTDARNMDLLLRFRGVPAKNVKLLISDDEQTNATRANIAEAIEWLRNQEGSRAIFYFAGHGGVSKNKKNLLLPSDALTYECKDTSPETKTALEESSINLDELSKTLAAAKFDQRYMILDACRTPWVERGPAPPPELGVPGFSPRGLAFDDDDSDTEHVPPITFFATEEARPSVEEKRSGVFTRHLLEGLRQDKSLFDLEVEVQEKVTKDNADQRPHLKVPKGKEHDITWKKQTYLLGAAPAPSPGTKEPK